MAFTQVDRSEVQLAPPGEDTYGLRVFVEEWRDGATGQAERRWKYHLPDGVQVLGFTTDGRVIAITEFRPGIGRYLHLVGETFEPDEEPATEDTILAAARRGLREETGYKAGPLELLTGILENAGKSDRATHYVLARDCEWVADPEPGIEVCLLAPQELWAALMGYFLADPRARHAGGNSLKLMALAFERLGFVTIKGGA
ncbi:MAG: NUDIX hydrolase [bacterium]|nr:NUDIX hydrolase [bacterium]